MGHACVVQWVLAVCAFFVAVTLSAVPTCVVVCYGVWFGLRDFPCMLVKVFPCPCGCYLVNGYRGAEFVEVFDSASVVGYHGFVVRARYEEVFVGLPLGLLM